MNTESLKYLEALGLITAFDNDIDVSSQIPKEILTAIENRDKKALEELLGARTNLVCGIFPAEDDEEDGDDSDEEPKETAQFLKAI